MVMQIRKKTFTHCNDQSLFYPFLPTFSSCIIPYNTIFVPKSRLTFTSYHGINLSCFRNHRSFQCIDPSVRILASLLRIETDCIQDDYRVFPQELNRWRTRLLLYSGYLYGKYSEIAAVQMASLTKSSKSLYGAPLGTMWREFVKTIGNRISIWIKTAHSVIIHKVQKSVGTGCVEQRSVGSIASRSIFTKHGKREVR